MNKFLNYTLEVDVACKNDKEEDITNTYRLILPFPDSFKNAHAALQKLSEQLVIWEKEILAQEEKRKAEQSGPIEVVAEPIPESVA